MNSKEAIEAALSRLTNTMRMYVEANLSFRSVLAEDPEEAVNNLDRTFELKLEAFHTLYDVSKNLFSYFNHGDTAALITIRNAVHHRNHPLFHSLNRHLYVENHLQKKRGASLLIARHMTTHGADILMSHCILLTDLDARIDPTMMSTHCDRSLSTIKALDRYETINRQLSLEAIREHATKERYPSDQVYLDLTPVFVSGVCKVFRSLQMHGIEFRGADAETYEMPFTSEIDIDLSQIELKQIRL